MRLNRQIVGFKKVKFYTMENVGSGNLSLSEQEMHTTAFWLHFSEAFLARFADLTPTEKQAGLIGTGALLRTVGSLAVMCDPRDLRVSITEAIAVSLMVIDSSEPNAGSMRTIACGRIIRDRAPAHPISVEPSTTTSASPPKGKIS